MPHALLNAWLRVEWWITCSLGRHVKFTVCKSAQDHTPTHRWCFKCNRTWPV